MEPGLADFGDGQQDGCFGRGVGATPPPATAACKTLALADVLWCCGQVVAHAQAGCIQVLLRALGAGYTGV
eukprot:65863-Chlamydomonas_euryale.AAC.3